MNACQVKPTTVEQVDLSQWDRFLAKQKEITGLSIRPDTIILDARPRFQFELSHLANAQWEDSDVYRFEKIMAADQKNIFGKWARHFALRGINPDSHVIVIGMGDQGKKNEALVAWALIYLGVTRTQMVDVAKVQKLQISKTFSIPPSQEYWEPKLFEEIESKRAKSAHSRLSEVESKYNYLKSIY